MEIATKGDSRVITVAAVLLADADADVRCVASTLLRRVSLKGDNLVDPW